MEKRALYKDDFAQYLLCLALDVGEGLLKTGGEVSRVEDTIERICYAYGAAHVEVFTIISVINAAIRMPDGSYSSQLRRVRHTTTDLGAIERYNALSREICATVPSLEEFDERIQAIKRVRTYPVWVHYLASAGAASAFAVFFGGFSSAVSTCSALRGVSSITPRRARYCLSGAECCLASAKRSGRIASA